MDGIRIIREGEMNDEHDPDLGMEVEEATSIYSDTTDDSLLTDDEITTDDEFHDEHYVQGPVPLREMLEYMKCSRDIDSISILSPSIPCLIHTMESKSVVKLFNTVGDIPTTSSRHCVKQKLRTQDGTIKVKKTPLHHFQNISLGTVTANNIRFHLVLYSIQHEGSAGKKKGYRPMTTAKRLVIVGALNLARMIQCHRIKRIKKAWTAFCQHGLLTLPEGFSINTEEISSFLNIISEGGSDQSSRALKHTQHWVSGGEIFHLKNDATKTYEVSTTRDNAFDFFCQFEAGLMLISQGILHCEEVWKWCFANVDINIMKKRGASVCSNYNLSEAAKGLLKYMLYSLTAAGIKGDFPKHTPYQFQDDGESLQSASQQFEAWLHQAGYQNMKNLRACFDDTFDFNNNGVTVTIDDGLTFDANEKKIMFLPSFDASRHEEFRDDRNSNNGDFDSVGDYDDEDGHDNDDHSHHGDDGDDNDDAGGNIDEGEVLENGSEIEEREFEEIVDNEERNSPGPIEEGMSEEVSMQDNENGEHVQDNETSENVLLTARMLAPSKPSKYPLLLHPLAASFHTGKIICSLVYGDIGISKLDVKGKYNSPVTHGDTVGYQGYLTSVKNTKGAAMLKNISRLGFLEKATFGLMHSSLTSDAKEFQELMDKCLQELDNLNFSKSTLSDTLSRSFCFRLECFRCFHSLHMGESNDPMHNYSYNVFDIPVFVCHKDKILRNYFNTLSLAKDVITCVFGGVDEAASDLDRLDARTLSPAAKTGIQFLSELLTFDVGTPSGFSRQGPIINALIASDASMTKFGMHYPSRGIELSSHDASLTGLSHGLNPKHWNVVDDDLNLHDEINRILGYTDTGIINVDLMPHLPINAIDIDKLRRELGKKLFRFKTGNKDRDKCTWQLLVSHAILAMMGGNDNGNVFGSVEYESVVKLFVNSKYQELEWILDRLAHIFWLCYDWEWRTDVMTHSNFRHLEVPLGEWPRTIGRLVMMLHGLAQPQNAKKLINSVEKLEGELFQHHVGGSADVMVKGASWKTCTHLELYRYIGRILAKARDMFYENHSNHSVHNPNIYLLSLTYFLTKISRTLLKRSGHGDMPYVWKTTKGYRKKNIGKFVAVDMKSLEKSTDVLELRLRGSNCLLLHRTRTSKALMNRIQMLHSLSHKNLHGILMKIPHDLSLCLSNDNISWRPGSIITMAHVLVTSLLLLGVRNNSGGGGVNWRDLLAVDASRLYDSLMVDDPFSTIALCGVNDELNKARLSNIHLLWDSKASFMKSCTKVKGAIRSRLENKKKMILTTPSTSFQLEELEKVVLAFIFDVVGENIKKVKESNNGRFIGVNENLVMQLKVLCLLLYMDEVQQRRLKASRVKMAIQPYVYAQRLKYVVENCHKKKYYDFVSDFNNIMN